MICPDDFRGCDAQEERPVKFCAGCGGEIYKGETVFQWDGEECDLCEDCFREKIDRTPLKTRADVWKLKYERV